MTIGRERILLERVKRMLTLNTQGGIFFPHCLKSLYLVVEEMQRKVFSVRQAVPIKKE